MSDFMDQLTEDEENALLDDQSTEIPDGTPNADDEPGQDDGSAAQDGDQQQAAADAQDSDGQKSDADIEAEFSEFLAKHQGKSVEELARLAFDKEKARRVERHSAQQAKGQIQAIQQKMHQAISARQQKQAQERQQFDEALQSDPDKAAKMAFERAQREEMERIQEAEWGSYVTNQSRLAASVIPDFEKNAPTLLQFGIQRMGYDEAQVRAVHDARDLVTLYMAMQFDKMVAAGMVNFDGTAAGQQQQQPGGVMQQQGQQAAARRQSPKTLSMASGGQGANKTLKQQAEDILAMDDAQFAAIPEAELEAILRQAGGQ